MSWYQGKVSHCPDQTKCQNGALSHPFSPTQKSPGPFSKPRLRGRAEEPAARKGLCTLYGGLANLMTCEARKGAETCQGLGLCTEYGRRRRESREEKKKKLLGMVEPGLLAESLSTVDGLALLQVWPMRIARCELLPPPPPPPPPQ